MTPEWNDVQTGALPKLIADGLTASQIGAIIGKSRNAVLGKTDRLGLQLKTGPGWAFMRTRYPAKPKPARPVASDEANPLHLPLEQVEYGMCRFPYGEGPFTFCCQPVWERSSYCATHHALCWVAPTGRAA